MKVNPKISIITITFNSAKTLRDTIKSVISQDYPNIEYVIIDGYSKDNTVDIIKEYSTKFSIIWSSEPDKGLYDAINKGIKQSSGEIIGLLHSDDVFATNQIISDIAKVFRLESDVMGVYGNIDYFKVNQDVISRKWQSKKIYSCYFEDGEIFPHTSFFVKKEVYDRIGVYRTDFKIGADYEFILRMVKVNHYPVYFLDKTVVLMRLGGMSTKSFRSILISFNEVRKAWEINNLSIPWSFYLKRYFKKLKQLT